MEQQKTTKITCAEQDVVRAAFKAVFDLEMVAQSTGIDLARVRRIHAKNMRQLARSHLKPEPAKARVAEQDVMLQAVQEKLFAEITAFSSEKDKLAALAQAAKQMRDVSDLRTRMSQDLGLVTSTRSLGSKVASRGQEKIRRIEETLKEERALRKGLEEKVKLLERELEARPIAPEPVAPVTPAQLADADAETLAADIAVLQRQLERVRALKPATPTPGAPPLL